MDHTEKTSPYVFAHSTNLEERSDIASSTKYQRNLLEVGEDLWVLGSVANKELRGGSWR